MAAKGFHPVKEYKPGESGNPNGRPKRDWTWASLMEKAAEEAAETGKTQKEILVEKAYELARGGDVVAMKEIFNRMDGMPTQKVDESLSGEVTVKQVSYEDIKSNE